MATKKAAKKRAVKKAATKAKAKKTVKKVKKAVKKAKVKRAGKKAATKAKVKRAVKKTKAKRAVKKAKVKRAAKKVSTKTKAKRAVKKVKKAVAKVKVKKAVAKAKAKVAKAVAAVKAAVAPKPAPKPMAAPAPAPAAPSTAAAPGAKTALNPAAAWPFPDRQPSVRLTCGMKRARIPRPFFFPCDARGNAASIRNSRRYNRGASHLIGPPMLFVDIVRALLDILGSLLVGLLLLRAWAAAIGMPARNPLAHFARALTDWLVQPLARVHSIARAHRMGSIAGRAAGDCR